MLTTGSVSGYNGAREGLGWLALRDVLYSDWRFGHYSDWLTLPRSSGFFIKYLEISLQQVRAIRMATTPQSRTENQGDQSYRSHNFCCMPHANQILSASRPDSINEQTVPSRRLQRTHRTILSASRPDNVNEHGSIAAATASSAHHRQNANIQSNNGVAHSTT